MVKCLFMELNKLEDALKKVNLDVIKKEQIWNLEQEVQEIAKEVMEQFQQIFQSQSYKLEITLYRIEDSPKHFPNCSSLSKEQCLQPHYCSYIGVTVMDMDGNLIGNEDDGYLFGDGVTIWMVEKSFLFFSVDGKFPLGCTKGYILALPSSEIKKVLKQDVINLSKDLGIEI
jgi:hypothetical protein